jgi:hypothetical protein
MSGPLPPSGSPEFVLRTLILFISASLLVASEAPIQPLLLPMEQLLKRLDQTQEWMLVPLAEYRALVSAGVPPESTVPGLIGARISTAFITGTLTDDTTVNVQGTLVVDTQGNGPHRCQLFAVRPARIGAVSCDGQPAVVINNGKGLDILVPGNGKHQLTLSWGIDLDGKDKQRTAKLPLPLAGGVSLAIHTTTAGSFTGETLVADPVQNNSWRLVRGATQELPLIWEPGRVGHDADIIFGADQVVQSTVVAGPSSLRWVVRLNSRRGQLPERIHVTLPTGWRLTQAASPGVVSIQEQSDSQVSILLASGTSEFACDGVRAEYSVVTLPTIKGAIYQGGSVMLQSDQAFDLNAPITWRRLENIDQSRRYAVSEPGTGVVPEIGQSRWGIDVRSSASIEVTNGQRPWQIIQSITVSDHGAAVGEIDVQVPTGWKILSLNSDQALTIRQLNGGGDIAELPPGAILNMIPRTVGARTIALTFTLERVDGTVTDVMPVIVRGSRRSSHRITVLSSDPIETIIKSQAPWRMGEGETHPFPAGTLRAELFATGDLAPFRIETKDIPPDVGLEAVVYLAPGLDDVHWCRVDMRLQVRSGEINEIMINSPILVDERLQIISSLLARNQSAATSAATVAEKKPGIKSDNRLTLHAKTPLIGEHVLRLEGPLAAESLGKLPRLTAQIGGQLIPVRQVVVIQAPAQADLLLNPGVGALVLAADALPAWSRPFPGISVSAAWRLTDGESGHYRLERRALAPGPAGFIDHVVVRSQIDHGETMTLLTARVAAPTLQALPLIIPTGMTLVQATIDGHEVAVRQIGSGSELSLPGRTQVQVALLLSGPSFKASAATTEMELSLPRLGHLPATVTAWMVAIANGWHVIVVDDPTAMNLQPQVVASRRPWLGAWSESPVDFSIPALPALPDVPVHHDQRALQTSVVAPPTTGEPQLVLRGHMWSGTRLGSETKVHLKLIPLSTLRCWDAIGWVLALVIAVLLTRYATWLVRGCLAGAALLCAVTLHEWQINVGPLLACSEWLAPAIVAAGCLWWLVQLRPSIKSAAPIVTLCLLFLNAFGGDAPTTVLMGYQRLDRQGLPQDVRVALTKAQLTVMWQRAQGATPTLAVCDLATGTPRYDLRVEGNSLVGTLSLAVAVPGKTWQQVVIPVVPGTVRSLSAKKLGHIDPGTVAWSTDDHGQLVLSLAPQQQADVVIALEIPLQHDAGARVTNIPLPAIPGGQLTLVTSPEWVPWLAERKMMAVGTGTWSCDLPSEQRHAQINQLPLALRGAPTVVARELHLAFEQRVRVALQRDHVEWQAVLTCTTQSGGLRTLPMTVPDGLVIISIEGECVADWTQKGNQVEVIATNERSGTWTVRLAGLFSFSTNSPTESAKELSALVQIPSAQRTSGLLEMTGGAGLRFERPNTPTVERVDPTDGADQAVRWNAFPGVVMLHWRADDDSLSAQLRATLSFDTDRVRVHAALELSGPGKRDVIRLNIPTPWHLVEVPKGIEVVWQELKGQRICSLRATNAWAAGASFVIQVEAERRVLGAQFQAPDLRPIASTIMTERQLWLFASAGDGRLRLEDHPRQQAVPIESALTTMGSLAVLRQQERWLQACSWRGEGAPQLQLNSEDQVVTISASHYLVLAQDRLRWSAHLVHHVSQGDLTTLRCTLPLAARLTRVSADGLGSWIQTGRELVVTLAGPTRQTTSLDLELELPLTGQSFTMEAITMLGGTGAQDIALVEEDELGLVHIDAQGLEKVIDSAAPFSCPTGIDHRAIRYRWRSQRPQWTLGIKRETLATSSGIDGVVTLADVVSVFGVDGECRSRGVWQALNRTRTQLTVRLPNGVELWEARVGGTAVQPRQGAHPNEIVLPVTPQKPGESTQAISLTWRERLAPNGKMTPGLPQFIDLRIMSGLWRMIPPPGFQLTRHGGSLLPVDDVVAEADRAQSVIDELKRLRGLGDLDDVGLKRLNDQLVTLDLQLSDNLVSLQQVDGATPQSMPQQIYNSRVITEVTSNRQELQRELQRIDSVRNERGQRRNKLGLDNLNQSWDKEQAAPTSASGTVFSPRAGMAIKARVAQSLANGATVSGTILGAGQTPPGQRKDHDRNVIGLDLLGETGSGGLFLRAQGNDLTVELTMSRTDRQIWPWLAAVSSLLLLMGGLWLSRR